MLMLNALMNSHLWYLNSMNLNAILNCQPEPIIIMLKKLDVTVISTLTDSVLAFPPLTSCFPVKLNLQKYK